jgi:TolA-binding protein
MTAALDRRLDDEETVAAKEILGLSCLHLADYRRCLEVLRGLRAQFPGRTRELLLAEARAEFGLGEAESGRKTIETYLGATGLHGEQRLAACLELAQGLASVGRLEEAEEGFRRVIREFPGSVRLKEAHFGLGLTLMKISDARPELLEQGRTELALVSRLMPLDETLDRKARFYVGECLRRQGRHEAAEQAFSAVAADYGGTREGVAAALRLASMMVSEGRFDAAREAFASVVAQLPAGGSLVNEYVRPEEIASVWQSVLRHYLSEGEYDEVEKRGRDLGLLAGNEVYFFLQAGLHRRRGYELREEADRLEQRGLREETARKREEARFNFELGARLSVRIVNGVAGDAELYGKALVLAAECLYESGDCAGAVVYYRILRTHAGRQHGQAVCARYARALQLLGRHEEALRELDAFFPHRAEPGTPAAYEAMLARARSCVALGNLDKAEAALTAIVTEDDRFAPPGRMWREALGELAHVLYRRGRFQSAVEKLDEMLSREGAVEASRFSRIEVTYWLADSYRSIRSADWTARRAELARAAEYFAQVHSAAVDEPSAAPETAWMVRRSRLAEADCRYELADYARAAALYESAAEKYLDGGEGVTALFGLAASLHRLGEEGRAVDAIRRARWCQDEMKKEHPEQATPFFRSEWSTLAAWSVLHEER